MFTTPRDQRDAKNHGGQKRIKNLNTKGTSQLRQVVLEDILDLHMRLNEISDQKAGFIMGIAGIILTIIVTGVVPDIDKINNFAKLGIAVISIGCLISLCLTIGILGPKMGERKRKDLFYYRSFLEHCTIEEYAEDLKKLLNDEDAIIEQYAKQIYSLGNLVLAPKFNRLENAAKILLLGIIIGSILVFFSVFL